MNGQFNNLVLTSLAAFDDGDICKIYDAWLEKTIGRRVVINIVFCLYEYVICQNHNRPRASHSWYAAWIWPRFRIATTVAPTLTRHLHTAVLYVFWFITLTIWFGENFHTKHQQYRRSSVTSLTLLCICRDINKVLKCHWLAVHSSTCGCKIEIRLGSSLSGDTIYPLPPEASWLYNHTMSKNAHVFVERVMPSSNV